MKKTISISKRSIMKAVAQSSRMEGLSLSQAKKNKAVIKKLKSYGRAFSI